MGKKRLAALLAFAVLGIYGAAGCGGADGQDNAGEEQKVQASAAEEATEETMEETQETESGETAKAPLTAYLTDETYALADQWNSCDDAALAAVMRKAAVGEDVTIACIGGSITQGTISSGSSDDEVGFKKCYADIFF